MRQDEMLEIFIAANNISNAQIVPVPTGLACPVATKEAYH